MNEHDQPRQPSQPRRTRGRDANVRLVLTTVAVVAVVAFMLTAPSLCSNVRATLRDFVHDSPRTGKCERQLTDIGQALKSYAADHNGEYPKTLDDLVPKYVKRKSRLICPADEQHAEYVYYRPSPSDPGNRVVILCDKHRELMYDLSLRKDGTVGPAD